MKRLAFVVTGVAALALAGCNKDNQDSVNNAEINQPAAEDLNALANDAATNAEDQALGNQQQQQATDQNAVTENNGPNPSEDEEKNVSGM